MVTDSAVLFTSKKFFLLIELPVELLPEPVTPIKAITLYLVASSSFKRVLKSY
jgi:hypothetical protein